MSPILHWIQADYQIGSSLPHQKGTDAELLESSSPFVADYVGPAPPPGSAPHRYIILLYEQPKDYNIQEQAPPDGKRLGNWMRMRFDLKEWETKNGLGRPAAMTYFLSN
jgi:phosphatidylethanolamine-binding protein